jgi:hypothetical protein
MFRGSSSDVLSINEFPYAFIGNSDMSDFGFILPDDPTEWSMKWSFD